MNETDATPEWHQLHDGRGSSPPTWVAELDAATALRVNLLREPLPGAEGCDYLARGTVVSSGGCLGVGYGRGGGSVAVPVLDATLAQAQATALALARKVRAILEGP